ncbi:hypothetical protein AAFG13_35805 [Bradyrhizobium sp. B124]|uniref:hypothetical protein n=1 Tax=Bradyrhizobium sp. B124 TaxID=3140245 RepID=UPI00318360ED
METELRAWLIDTLDFMIEQLNQAKQPSEQAIAVDAVQGLLPYLRARLKEDAVMATHFALALGDWVEPGHSKRVWRELANKPADIFVGEVDDIIEQLTALRDVVRAVR